MKQKSLFSVIIANFTPKLICIETKPLISSNRYFSSNWQQNMCMHVRCFKDSLGTHHIMSPHFFFFFLTQTFTCHNIRCRNKGVFFVDLCLILLKFWLWRSSLAWVYYTTNILAILFMYEMKLSPILE